MQKLHILRRFLVSQVRKLFALMTKTKRAKQITASALTASVVIISIFILEIPNVSALTQGPLGPSSDASVANGTSTTWSSPANILTSNSTYSTVTLASGAQSYYLEATGFGFTVPTGSTINGIQVDVEKFATTGSKNTMEDQTVELMVGGALSGSNLATTTKWPTANAFVTYGGASTLWGLTPTVSQVNASNFGVAIAARNVHSSGSSSSLTASVDYVQITVTYTAPTTSLSQSAYQFYNNQNGSYANGTSWSQATSNNGFTGVMNAQALSFNGDMWQLGGQYGTTATYVNSVACSTDGINWNDTGCGTTGAAWSGRSMFGAVVFNNKMWVLGGMSSGGSPVANVYCSNDGTTWSDSTCGTASAPWGAEYGLSAVVFNNKIYVIGGNNGSSTLNDVWSSSDGTNWTEVTAGSCSTACANSFPARSNAQVFVFGNKLYIMGGFSGATYYDDVWSSTDGSTWTQVTANGTSSNAPWSGRGNVAGVVYNGDMWIMGGWNGTSYLNDVWCSADGANWYDTTTGGQCGGTSAASWSGRNAPASVVYQNRIWVMGGKTGTSNWASDVWSSAPPAIGVGTSLAAADTSITSPADGQPFRLRLDVNVANASLSASGQAFKLQYAPLTGGSCAASAFFDVTSTTPVSYYNNSVGSPGEDISTTFPTDPASPTGYTAENYQQYGTNYFSNPYAISAGYDGYWDFALTTNQAIAGTTYCLKMVQYTALQDRETNFTTYTNYPEITAPASSLGQASYRFYKNQDATSAGGGWTQAATSGTNYAAALGRYQGTSLVYNNKLWMLGGYSSSSALLNNVYSSTDGSNWTQATAAAGWTARGEFASVVFNNEMCILGGFDSSSQYKDDVWCSSDGSAWTQVTAAASWAGRQGLRALSYNGKMYIMGGYDGTNEYNDVWSTSDGSTWTENTSAAPWSGRDDMCALVYNNKMWVMGGEDSNSGIGNNEVWSSSDGTNWTEQTTTASWDTRFAPQCTVANSKMYIMGGYDTLTVGYAADSWSSTDGINWTQNTAPSWGARAYGAGLTFNGNIWILGGYGNGVTLNDGWYLPSSAVDVGLPLTEQNNPIDLTKFDDTGGTPTNLTAAPFRLRWDISNTGGGAATSGLSLSLQYAEQVGGSCAATAASGTWANVSTTTPVQFYTGNTNATNGDTLIQDANDPTDGNNYINYQTFNTANPVSNTQSTIYSGQDGLWDFALVMASNVPHTNYCMRMYDNNAASAISSNSTYPEVDMGPTMTQLLRGRSWWNASGVREFKDL